MVAKHDCWHVNIKPVLFIGITGNSTLALINNWIKPACEIILLLNFSYSTRNFFEGILKPNPFPVKSGFSYQGTSIALTEAREIENKGGTQRIRYPDMPAISRCISFRLRLQHREMPARHQSSSFAIQDHTPPIARRNQSPAPTQRQRPDGQLTYVFGMRAFYILLVDHGIA